MNRTEHSPEISPAVSTGRNGRRGPRLAGIGLVFIALAASAAGCAPANSKDPTDVAALPQEVRDGLDRAARAYPEPLAGARWLNVAVLHGTDHPLYQLRGTNGRGHTIEAEVTKAGRVIEVEEHGIPLGEVPAEVAEVLRANRPQFKPERVEAIYQGDNRRPVAYGFEGADASGKTIEVYISADGKALLN
jgi:glucose/arabinose dehydrogenase